MKLFWKASSLGLFACGLLFAGAIFTGCYSSSIDPIFSDTPTPPVMTGSPATGYTAAEVARFHVGDTVIVTLSGLPKPIEPHQEPIKEDGTITMPDIGHVQAAGKTAGELQNEIYNLYVPKLYRHLTVTVNHRRSRLLRHRRSQAARPPALRRPNDRYQGHYHCGRFH